MSKNKLIYSTNPNQSLKDEVEDEDMSLEASSQKLRIRLETKQRAGKKATIIHGYQGSDTELEALAKKLKTKLGVGGSVKEGEIIIQGDYIAKAKELLIQLGYKNTK
jgi:translation initiation factor 1